VPSGRRGRKSISSAEKEEESADVEPGSTSYQAQVSSRTSLVPDGAAGAAGWVGHHAPEHGRGSAGTDGGSDRAGSPPETSTTNASIREG
jgi:hypothetical protein